MCFFALEVFEQSSEGPGGPEGEEFSGETTPGVANENVLSKIIGEYNII